MNIQASTLSVQVKNIKVSRSVLQQMEYVNYLDVASTPESEVLGWVYVDATRKVIVKHKGRYRVTAYITEVQRRIKTKQFDRYVDTPHGQELAGYDDLDRTHVTYCTYNVNGVYEGKKEMYVNRDEEINLKRWAELVGLMQDMHNSEQIYI